MVDIVLTGRPRHAEAERLRLWLKARGIRIRMPMHALFELAAAMRQEKIAAAGAKLRFNPGMTEASPFGTDPIPIDDEFFAKYFEPSLPYLKGGDLIFVAMAKKDEAVLVTEDTKQLKAAKQAGVAAYDISEFLVAFP